jgi:hypothetical protein
LHEVVTPCPFRRQRISSNTRWYQEAAVQTSKDHVGLVRPFKSLVLRKKL